MKRISSGNRKLSLWTALAVVLQTICRWTTLAVQVDPKPDYSSGEEGSETLYGQVVMVVKQLHQFVVVRRIKP